MNILNTHKRKLIIRLLVEGNSIRATARIAEVQRNTVSKLLVDAGKACAEYQDSAFQDLPCRRMEVDEIWSFVYAKQKNVPRATNAPAEAGDVWTWTAICADTKLVPVWRLGDRTSMTAIDLMDDLRARLSNRIQLTSDGHKAYFDAVEGAFGGDVDYAQLVKIYGQAPEEDKTTRYSPSVCTGSKKKKMIGQPDSKLISTSYVERQNLTMRMSMRRFTRLTNAFSKKLENHAHAVALHYMYYNFCRIHQTLETTPAKKAGVADRVWSVEDLVRMIEQSLPKPKKRGKYKPRKSNSK